MNTCACTERSNIHVVMYVPPKVANLPEPDHPTVANPKCDDKSTHQAKPSDSVHKRMAIKVICSIWFWRLNCLYTDIYPTIPVAGFAGSLLSVTSHLIITGVEIKSTKILWQFIAVGSYKSAPTGSPLSQRVGWGPAGVGIQIFTIAVLYVLTATA